MAVKPKDWVDGPITSTEPELVHGEKTFDEVIQTMQGHHSEKPDDLILGIYMGARVFESYRHRCEARGDPMPMAADFLLGCPVIPRKEEEWPVDKLVATAMRGKDGVSYILMAVNLLDLGNETSDV